MTKRILIAAVCLLMTCLSGCATVGSKTDAEQADDPEWLEDLRSLDGTRATLGVSREAREIEKSLGAR